jgi:RimJ/RimL family protein N-acetyltransferase
MSHHIPVVETERLVLRAFRESDLDAFAAMSADAEVMRYIGSGETVDRNGTWRTMAGFLGHWSLRGCGMWAIERKRDGAFLGRVGLHHPPYWPALEAGWVLARDAWGQGYACEGAAAALDFSRRALPPQRLVSFIRPGNERSVKVALALGARREADGDLLGLPVQVYVHHD